MTADCTTIHRHVQDLGARVDDTALQTEACAYCDGQIVVEETIEEARLRT